MPAAKDPVMCPVTRHYQFDFFAKYTSLADLKASVRNTGDVSNWLQHFPWCLFHLTGQYHNAIHPFRSIAQATTVHSLGVALLEAIYTCLLKPCRDVGGQLEASKDTWPDWFKAVDPENTMTTRQREAVLLLSCPPVVQYPPPHAHGASDANYTHHDTCLRLRAVEHCRNLCFKHRPYPALRVQYAKASLQAESIVLPVHAALTHLVHSNHAGQFAAASISYEKWVQKNVPEPQLEELLRRISGARRNRLRPPRRVVVVHRDERLENQLGDAAIPEVLWQPTQLPWVNMVKTTRCISTQCINIHHLVYATQSHNASTGSTRRQKLHRIMRYVHYRTL